jgi:hypothetical protein
MACNNDARDVFAYFGRAFYLACNLESRFANAVLQLEFLTRVKREFEKTGKLDPEKVNYEFDAFMEKQHSLTMGQLINWTCPGFVER